MLISILQGKMNSAIMNFSLPFCFNLMSRSVEQNEQLVWGWFTVTVLPASQGYYDLTAQEFCDALHYAITDAF